VLTSAGEVVVIPNTQVLSSKLSNHGTNPLNQVTVKVGISYRSSIQAARKALVELVKDDPRIMKEPAPGVGVASLGDSSVNLSFGFWIADESLEGKLRGEYTEKTKNALEAAGVEIPFPHVQLLVESTPAMAALAGQKPERQVN
jgi:small conductance mechanosensitive channel